MKPIEPVTILLDKERAVVFNMAALMRAERIINKQRREDGLEPTSIFRLIADATESASVPSAISAQFATVLLWSALANDDPGLSVDDVGRMVPRPFVMIRKVFDGLNAYFTNANADDEEAGTTEPPLDRPNGLASGRLPESN